MLAHGEEGELRVDDPGRVAEPHDRPRLAARYCGAQNEAAAEPIRPVKRRRVIICSSPRP